jgi:predicted RNA binding protein YcfA (HicA-like mRNA interferase family)
MPRQLRQLKADLRRAGASIVQQNGSHVTWRHPAIPGVLIEPAETTGTMPILIRSAMFAMRSVGLRQL